MTQPPRPGPGARWANLPSLMEVVHATTPRRTCDLTSCEPNTPRRIAAWCWRLPLERIYWGAPWAKRFTREPVSPPWDPFPARIEIATRGARLVRGGSYVPAQPNHEHVPFPPVRLRGARCDRRCVAGRVRAYRLRSHQPAAAGHGRRSLRGVDGRVWRAVP